MHINKQYHPKTIAFIGLALTNLFWAGNAVLARFVINDIPPFTLVFGRWLLAFLILLPFAWPHLKGSLATVRERWFLLLILGILGIATYNTIQYLAAHSTTAINIGLVSSSLPLIALLFSWLLLKIRPTNWQLMGIAASLFGVLIIITQGRLEQLVSMQFNQGDILMLGIAFLWAFYSVLLRKYPIDLHPIALLTILVAIGLPFLFALFFIEVVVLPPFSLKSSAIPIFIFAAIFPSILSYMFWGHGIKVVGPSIAAMSCYLLPLFTAMLAYPILSESLYWHHFIGGMLILIGLYFGSLFKQKSI